MSYRHLDDRPDVAGDTMDEREASAVAQALRELGFNATVADMAGGIYCVHVLRADGVEWMVGADGTDEDNPFFVVWQLVDYSDGEVGDGPQTWCDDFEGVRETILMG